MRLIFPEIKQISQCHRLYHFRKKYGIDVVPRNISIIGDAMKTACMRWTRRYKKPQWRSVIHWVDKEVFKDIDVDNKEQYGQARKYAEALLSILQRWYVKEFMDCEGDYFTDVPIFYEFDRFVIYDVVPILQINDVPRVTYIQSVGSIDINKHDDISIIGPAWLLMRELEYEKIEARFLLIGETNTLTIEPRVFYYDRIKGAERMLQQLCFSIGRGDDYPSFRPGCEDCVFNKQCKI